MPPGGDGEIGILGDVGAAPVAFCGALGIARTYIEPGERYGSRELDVLRRFVSGRAPAPQAERSQATLLTWSGLQAVIVLTAVTALGTALLGWRVRRRLAAEPVSPPWHDADLLR